MTKQEKENIIAGLINIGCTRRCDGDDYNWTYKHYKFTIRESYTLTDVFKKLMAVAENLKIWEIKSVLNIID